MQLALEQQYNNSSNQSLLERFYQRFAIALTVLLVAGVTVIFDRRLVSGLLCSSLLLATLACWRLARRGQLQRSLKWFSSGAMALGIVLLLAGWPPMTLMLLAAIAFMQALIVGLRWAVYYVLSFMLVWLGYATAQYLGLTPAPFFSGARFTGWFLNLTGGWLLLVPLPALFDQVRHALSLQRTLLDASLNGILILGRDGRTEAYNQKFLDMWGLTPELAVDRTAIRQATLPKIELAGLDPTALDSVYANTDQGSADIVHLKTGQIFERTSEPQILDGKPIGRIWTYRDITQNEKARQERADRQEIFQAIVTQAVDSICLIDSQSLRLVEFNQAACDSLGYTREEFANLTLLDLQAWPDEIRLRADLSRELQAGQNIFETTHRRKDGSLRHVRISNRALTLQGRSLLTSITTDITNTRAREQQLQLAQAHFERIASQVQGIIFEFREESDGRTSMPFVSRAIEKIYNLSAAEVREDSSKMLSRVHPDDQAHYYAAARASMTRLVPFQMEWRILSPDGQVRWMSGSGEPSRNLDGSTLLHGFIVDITELKRVQFELERHRNHLRVLVDEQTSQLRSTVRQLEHAEAQALSASRAKSTFLANMSHEIRTPMNGLLGISDVLCTTELNDQQRRLVLVMRESATSLLAIVNDILDLSKIEAGKLNVESIPASLRQILDGVTQVMLAACASQQIQLECHIDPAVPDWFFSDPTRLRQILFNLVGNAIKFVADPRLRQAQVRITAAPAVDDQGTCQLKLQVSDNGIGMNADIQAGLFQSFSQADASTARRFGGTGLGLSITKQLVGLMGGSISVSSKPDVGSDFVVLLPLMAAPSGEALATSSPTWQPPPTIPLPMADQVVRAGSAILLAEDNETNRMVLREQLQLLGYKADEAADGQIALEMWTTGNYALLLTDCHMPGLDGFGLAQAIRSAEAGRRRRPIVAITANVMDTDSRRCLAAGIDDVLAKPLRLEELDAALDRWLIQLTEPVWERQALVQILGERPTLHRNMMTTFLNNAKEQLQRLQQAALEDDQATATRVAHQMKSSAKAVGAMQVAQTCKRIEESQQAPSKAPWQSLVLFLQSQFDDFVELANAWLGSDENLVP